MGKSASFVPSEHPREPFAPVNYDPAALCPRWLSFLDQVFAGDQKLIEFTRRSVGCALASSDRGASIYFLHGSGCNGKSVFLDTLQGLFGSGYSATIDSREMGGKLLAVGSEVDANAIELGPTRKLFIANNQRPCVEGTAPAVWSRIKLVPFAVSFEGREDRGLKAALLGELSGILNWAIEGYDRWMEMGLDPPAGIQVN